MEQKTELMFDKLVKNGFASPNGGRAPLKVYGNNLGDPPLEFTATRVSREVVDLGDGDKRSLRMDSLMVWDEENLIAMLDGGLVGGWAWKG